ncbi:MAG TPA: GIY-YIG nuclease family protein [Luteimonas sp.]|nr:GIY-YIG nuclease family protein [Luteimonas sp.]
MAREYRFFVYIHVNSNCRVMYIGMTNDLIRRIEEHRNKAVPGFTAKYNVHRLVYFEETSDVFAALAREKQLKGWRRSRKDALVTARNPGWRDLAGDFAG